MAWIDPKWRKQPAELRDSKFWTLKGYRLGACSFGLLYDRGAFEGWAETFSYICDHCGARFNKEPQCHCTQRETWGHWGGTPAEYEWVCPSCDRLETVYENDDPDLGFKAKNRRKIRLRRNPCAS